jgi:hypothetical protein
MLGVCPNCIGPSSGQGVRAYEHLGTDHLAGVCLPDSCFGRLLRAGRGMMPGSIGAFPLPDKAGGR